MNRKMESANHAKFGGAVKSEALFREHGNQVAALCWRNGKHGLEVLLITSLNSKRWILPKGWPEADLTGGENAAREAFEEAGVTGKIATQPVGHYYYLKEKRDSHGMPVHVDVFALAVTKELDDWPEKNVRTLAWMPLSEAIEKISEPGVRLVLKNFHKHHATRKPAVAARRHV
ncbi:MAG TPA: NUDIX hydrolase [Rhizomicrobium sp.]|nr:NUDIX hydrolase [Rhizomicrobium sp.]